MGVCIYIYIYLCIPLFLCLHMHIPRYIQHHMYIYHIYSLGHPVGRDFPAYCIWKLAKFGWYPGFWLRGLWVGVLNLSQLTPPVSRKSCRDNRWIIFHLLNSAYCIRVPDGPSAQDHKRHPSIVVSINLNRNINIYIYNIYMCVCKYIYICSKMIIVAKRVFPY